MLPVTGVSSLKIKQHRPLWDGYISLDLLAFQEVKLLCIFPDSSYQFAAWFIVTLIGMPVSGDTLSEQDKVLTTWYCVIVNNKDI